MTGTMLTVIVLVAAVCAAASYLYAKARIHARLSEGDSARQVAEEQSREARRQVDELRADRDHSRERADRLEVINSEFATERRELGEQIGKIAEALDATRANLQAREVEVERLRTDVASGQTQNADLLRQLRAAEQNVAELRGREEQLREQLHEVETAYAALEAENVELREQALAMEVLRKQMDDANAENMRLQKEAIEAIGAKLLARSEETLVSAAEAKLTEISKPVQEGLAQIDKQLRDFETSRTKSEAGLQQEIKGLSEESLRHREQTRGLVQALKRPEIRGSWGEMHLRRAVELAGMQERCDFDLQVHIPGEDDRVQRPDMVVHLPGGKHVIVDSKVPMDAFVAATETDDQAHAAKLWVRHVKQVRQHIDGLASKEYFRKIDPTPEFVLMFVPSESFLQPALEKDPELLEYAAAKQVLIVTPVTLIAGLRAIAFGWKQEALRENLRQVLELGTEIYERLSTMGKNVEKLGTAIDRSVKAYNETVGSLEGRVMVTARRFRDMKVVEAELPNPQPKNNTTRPLTSPELIASAMEELQSAESVDTDSDAHIPSEPEEPQYA